jgi:hypothetical protein
MPKEGVILEDKQKERLERYLTNGDFLWGLIVHFKKLEEDSPYVVMNQQDTYDELGRKYHLHRDARNSFRGSYADVTKELIKRPDLGIETILKKVVAAQVTELVNNKTLEYLRACWFSGARPQARLVEDLNPDNRHAYPFLSWNRQHKFFEGWSAFAYIYWEEIEDIIREDIDRMYAKQKSKS